MLFRHGRRFERLLSVPLPPPAPAPRPSSTSQTSPAPPPSGAPPRQHASQPYGAASGSRPGTLKYDYSRVRPGGDQAVSLALSHLSLRSSWTGFTQQVRRAPGRRPTCPVSALGARLASRVGWEGRRGAPLEGRGGGGRAAI